VTIKTADYADAIRERYGVGPFIFLTNGDEIRFWHGRLYAPRKVSGESMR
jgi:type I restriction enzyme R subunit